MHYISYSIQIKKMIRFKFIGLNIFTRSMRMYITFKDDQHKRSSIEIKNVYYRLQSSRFGSPSSHFNRICLKSKTFEDKENWYDHESKCKTLYNCCASATTFSHSSRVSFLNTNI